LWPILERFKHPAVSVPLYEYIGGRSLHFDWAETKGEKGLVNTSKKKLLSLDDCLLASEKPISRIEVIKPAYFCTELTERKRISSFSLRENI
jgi:hypothetical protein